MRRHWWAALAVAAAAALPLFQGPIASGARGVRVEPRLHGDVAAAAFDPAQSAALFVGVRDFHDRDIETVRYAVDDAVDLAYAFALDARVALVRPGRVVLALSGKPQKEVSRIRLQRLREAGAAVTQATQSEIITQLKKQTALAGPNGVLVVSFATHGFSEEGAAHVLAESSILDFPETTLPVARVLDMTASAAARRSIVFIDACRERVASSRALGPDPLTVAPLLEEMSKVEGQVVFYGAAAGRYTYDDLVRRNGVFTSAILDGLQCQAGADAHGLITVESLANYVEKEVRGWIRRNRDPDARTAIQVSHEGDTLQMPLATCGTTKIAAAPVARIAHIALAASMLRAYAADGSALWQRDGVAHAELIDGNAVIATGRSLVALDASQTQRWTVDVAIPIRTFTPEHLFRQTTRELLLVCDDAEGTHSRIAVVNTDGALLGTYDHAARIRAVAVDRLTARHRPKIIAISARAIVMLDPKRVTPLWSGRTTQDITRLTTTDHDNDSHRDIALTTITGDVLHLTFDGSVLESSDAHPRFELMAATQKP